MSAPFAELRAPSSVEAGPPRGQGADAAKTPLAGQYALSLLFVSVAAVLAFVVGRLIAAPNLALIFVLPVVIAATVFGWGPSLAAAAGGVLAFDFFFTAPYYSFRIASPSDIWAASLLLVIAAIVSTVAAESRRRAVAAEQVAQQADALRRLAHAVVEGRPPGEIAAVAAETLTQIFSGPAAIFIEHEGRLERMATTGGEPADDLEEAVQGALQANTHIHAGTYPFDRCEFDLWPITAAGGRRMVLGVNLTSSGRQRPEHPERLVEVVAGYLASAPGA